jgi:hypothetical protein
VLVGIEYSDRESQVLTHDLYGFHQVRVVAYYYGNIKELLKGIVEQVCGEVDVRALLFGLVYPYSLGRVAASQCHGYRMGREVAEDDRDVG